MRSSPHEHKTRMSPRRDQHPASVLRKRKRRDQGVSPDGAVAPPNRWPDIRYSPRRTVYAADSAAPRRFAFWATQGFRPTPHSAPRPILCNSGSLSRRLHGAGDFASSRITPSCPHAPKIRRLPPLRPIDWAILSSGKRQKSAVMTLYRVIHLYYSRIAGTFLVWHTMCITGAGDIR
jgi:hypothetical protein